MEIIQMREVFMEIVQMREVFMEIIQVREVFMEIVQVIVPSHDHGGGCRPQHDGVRPWQRGTREVEKEYCRRTCEK